MKSGPSLSGRRAQAARNDELIMRAARTVLINDPDAPIAAVAQEAGVGISALYKRFGSKEGMISRLCYEGLSEYNRIARVALEIDDPGEAFVVFIRGIVDADVHSLTVHLAGRFTPRSGIQSGEVRESAELTSKLLDNAQADGAVRSDLMVNDIPMLLEQMTAIRIGDAARTQALRHRYLSLIFDALGLAPSGLPGKPPTDRELGARWIPHE